MKKILFILFTFFYFSLQAQLILKDLREIQKIDTNAYPFFFGVASGEPTDTSIIIWTKIVPEKLIDKIKVYWFVAQDTNLQHIVYQGITLTTKQNFYTVKIKVKPLKPHKKYFYAFKCCGKLSPVGRFKSLPSYKDNINKIQFAVFTGSNYSHGFFNVYNLVIKNNDIDFWIHLGDYIYEYGNRYARTRNFFPEKEIISRNDYEKRYAQYRLDTNLQELHRLYACYVIWDDHEFANNAWKNGALNHQPSEGPWSERKKIAKKTFFNWLPITPNKENSVFKSYSVGNLAKLIFLDTRIFGRSKQNLPLSDTSKTILAELQRKWLLQQLKNAKDSFAWKIICQQVMFAPLKLGKKIINNDQWDGYPFDRQKILNFIINNKIQNVLILSGDIHSSWANKIKFKGKNLSNEFITPSVSSYSTSKLKGKLAVPVIKIFNLHIKFTDLIHRGYLKITITKQKVKGTWFLINTVDKTNYKVIKIRSFCIDFINNRLKNCKKHLQ